MVGAQFCVQREMWLIPTKYSTAILFTQLDISNDGDMEPDCYEGNTYLARLHY